MAGRKKTDASEEIDITSNAESTSKIETSETDLACDTADAAVEKQASARTSRSPKNKTDGQGGTSRRKKKSSTEIEDASEQVDITSNAESSSKIETSETDQACDTADAAAEKQASGMKLAYSKIKNLCNGRSFLTYDEINAIFSLESLNYAELDEIYDYLDKMKIEVISEFEAESRISGTTEAEIETEASEVPETADNQAMADISETVVDSDSIGVTEETAVPEDNLEETQLSSESDLYADPRQIQANAESFPEEEVFFMPIKKLSRKRGKKVSVKREEPLPAAEERDASEKPSTGSGAFVAHILEPIHVSPGLRVLGEYDLASMERKVSRRRGKIYTRQQYLERAAKVDGTIHAVFEDRSPVLRMNILPMEQEFYERISLHKRRELLDYLESSHNEFNERIRHFVEHNLVLNWYNFVPPVLTEPEPVDENAPVDEAAEVGPDLAAAAIFDIFEQPLERFVFEETDPDKLHRLYCTHHAGRITSLLCDWAHALPYIDRGVFGGPANTPLSICFVRRFQQILTLDFESARDSNVRLPDFEIMERFHLDDIDLLLLWILAGHEMDNEFRKAVRSTWDQQSIIYMSTGTLMRYFCTAAEEKADVMRRLSPSSVMAVAGLFKLIQGSVPTQPLVFEIVVSEQIVRLFYGIRSLSVASTQYAELLFPNLAENTFVAEEHAKTFSIIQNYLERPALNSQPNLERDNLNFIPSMAFQVEGLPGSGRTTFIKLLASRFKRPLIIVQTSPIVGIHPTDCDEYLKRLFNDAALMNAFVAFREAGPILSEERLAAAFARHLSRYPIVCAFCIDLAVKTHPVIEPYLTFKTKMNVNLKDSAAAFWNQHLNLPQLNAANVDVHALSQRLALQPFQIQKATKLAYYSTDLDEKNGIELSNKKLEKAAAVQVTKNIGNLAFVSDPEIDLSDVIVSDDIMEKIKRIIGSAQNRRRVLYEWGLSKRIRRGTGVIALFDGEPGTGKTHSAEAIAHELGLSLMRINIATMVDKYVGETEKNLTTIFEQARPDMQLLLFDEADSLFTKRTSNVSKSNDRYSNMSVNVLLQLVERYEGVSILTTNLKNAIDPAFERRITYKVYFPMPKKPERERLWRYMCPPEILTAEPIDYEWLSELEMSGGEIKNSVLTAAFTAATNGVLLNSEILYNAGVMEASAAGRVLRRYEEGDDFVDY